jgi:hypothetical protein
MGEEEFNAFLEKRGFDYFELYKLKSASKESRTSVLGDIALLRNRNSADRELRKFTFYYHVNRVYVQRSLQIQIMAVADILNRTFVAADMDGRHPSASERNTGFEKLDGLIEEIEKKMRERVRLDEA